MEERDGSQSEVVEHNWVYASYDEVYFCVNCKVEVSKYLYELEADDNPECGYTNELLDKIVDVECE